MVGASKILTVSYGTFSCTLEGFDDSFSTMKAIAEYFRDLAADDRYFGAEPATPDADMLARIAEHEIKKRVEAKVGDNSILLRASEEPTSLPRSEAEHVEQEPVAEQPAPAEAIVQEAPEPEIEISEPVAEAPASPFTPAPEGDSESVAAKLQRIRAVVARNQSAVSATPFFEEEEDADVFEAAPQEAAVEDVAEVEQPVSEAAPAVEEEPVAEDAFEAEEESVVEDTPAMEDEPAVEETLFVPEEPVSDELGSEEAQQSDEEAESTFNKDAAFDDETFDDEAPVEASDLTALLGRVAGGDAAETAQAQPEETASADEDQDLSAFIAADLEGHEDDDAPTAEDEAPLEIMEEEDTEENAERLEAASAAAQRARARVIKMKSEDFEEAVSSGALEDAVDAEGADVSEAAPDVAETEETPEDDTTVSDLTPEQEAELMQELAEVEKEMEVVPAERSGRAILDSASTEDEASVSRLMEETNSQLDSPETSRRRSAISHLRAAVAATVAERLMGSPKADKPVEDEADAFRADLASVVRPSSRQDARKERGKNRPAPLVLVSAQRIDTDKDSSSTSGADVRPRRVQKSNATLREVDESFGNDSEDGSSEANTNIFAENTSFGEFAEGTDATELPDLLEAAAAYTAFVQGLPHFTRPHVMRLVAQFQGDNQFSREEGLRAFGQLLRQGKILKTKRGQFEIADTTKFKPEARYAG